MSKQKILEIAPAYVEAERKYNFTSLRGLRRVFAHVRRSTDYFVTLSDPRFVDPLPDVCNLDFEAPLEVTAPRDRRYYDTPDLDLIKNGLELRQELKIYGAKQVLKIDETRPETPTLVRTEYPSKLSEEGINYKAIYDRNVRKRVQKIVGKNILFPMITITSQRARLVYHPAGDREIEIEVSFDQLCGQTFEGYAWAGYQVEMEMKSDVVSLSDIDAVFDEQEKHIFKDAKLERNLSSKPTPGYDHLKQEYKPSDLKQRLVA